MPTTTQPTVAPSKKAKSSKGSSSSSSVWTYFFFLGALICTAGIILSFVKPVRVVSQDELERESEAQLSASLAEEYRQRYSANFWSTPEAQSKMLKAKEGFLNSSAGRSYGYGNHSTFEATVASDLSRFAGDVYLDYTGGGVFLEKQLRAVYEELSSKMYGNPHSRNPSSSASERQVSLARDMILKRFHTTASEYSVIFTSGATAALKLVAESFPWTNASNFVYLRQNHNSVLGIREVAMERGSRFIPIPEDEMNEDVCNKYMGGSSCGRNDAAERKHKVMLTEFPDQTYSLFAYPAEENFAGALYPLEWINLFHRRARGEAGTGHWMVLLDAAAYVPTHDLDLSKYPADFVVLSFYKLFGYPTGLGALLVRNDATFVMQKTFFGGGTVIASSCDTHFCLLHQNPCNRFEDGTVSFLGIAALKHGFAAVDGVSGTTGMKGVEEHVKGLTEYLYNGLSSLKHSNGAPVMNILGKHSLGIQGGIINVNVLDPEGKSIGYHIVQETSSVAHIHIRTGCNCNPGACYDYLGVSSQEVQKYSLEKKSCGDELDRTLDGKPLGGVRISLGYMTTFEDVYAMIEFMRQNFVKQTLTAPG